MRCSQLLSLSVTLATVLVLVKCEPAGNTPPAQEKASGDQQDTKDTINHRATNVNASATNNETVLTTSSSPEMVKPTTNTTAPKEDGKGYETTTATKGDEPTTAPKGDEPSTAPKGDETTIKPPVKVTTTTPKPHNSTSSALTALSAVTLCVLSLTVSL